MQEMIGHDPHGRGEIQTADSPPNRNAIALVSLAQFTRQSRCFSTEKQIVPVMDACLGIVFIGVAAEADDPGVHLAILVCDERRKILMVLDIHLMPIVQSRSFQMLVIDLKSQGMNEVQSHLGSAAQACDVSGVGRNLGLVQDHMKRRIRYGLVGFFRDVVVHIYAILRKVLSSRHSEEPSIPRNIIPLANIMEVRCMMQDPSRGCVHFFKHLQHNSFLREFQILLFLINSFKRAAWIRNRDTANASHCRSVPKGFPPCRCYRSEIHKGRSNKRVEDARSNCIDISTFFSLFFFFLDVPS